MKPPLFKNLVGTTVVVHKGSFPLRSSAIIKVKITNSLKPPLTKRPCEVGYWELNEMLGSGGCLRQKKPYRLLKVNHKFMNF